MRKSECCSLFGHEPPHIEARTARAEAAHLNDVFLSHSLSTFATVLLLCLFVSFFSPSVLLCSGFTHFHQENRNIPGYYFGIMNTAKSHFIQL